MKKIFFLLCASFFLVGFSPALAADSGCSGFESQFNFLGSADKVDLSTGLPKVCTAGSPLLHCHRLRYRLHLCHRLR
ncbi:MAG: hypothetical protein M1333_03445, partial [Patescibacteria group bacterium]|nr:hypothetical protein [Patescibacteria group bacterium]